MGRSVTFHIIVDVYIDAHQSPLSSAIHPFSFEVVFEARSWIVIAFAMVCEEADRAIFGHFYITGLAVHVNKVAFILVD